MNNTKDFIGRWDSAVDESLCKEIISYFEVMKNNGFSQSRQSQNQHKSKLEQDTESLLMTTNMIRCADPQLHTPILNGLWNQWFPEYISTYASLNLVDNFYINEMKLQKTDIGQGYHEWHFETDTASTARRIFNYHVYLNTVDQGGETEFLYYARREKPTVGTVLIYPGYFTHTHRGNPPISNSKYLLNGWIEL